MSGSSKINNAARHGHLDVLNLVIETGEDLNSTSSPYDTPLIEACRNGHLESIRLLLEAGADINFLGKYNTSALQEAISARQSAAAELLVVSGANVNEMGPSPIYVAADRGLTEVVRLLIENGADVSLGAKRGQKPLHIASYQGHRTIVDQLLVAGADVDAYGGSANACYGYGFALHGALGQGHEDVAMRLISAGANVKLCCPNFGSALQIAAKRGLASIVAVLLQYGVEVDAINGRKETALDAASGGGHLAIVDMLLAAGANANLWTSEKGSALIAASQCGHAHVVKRLLAEGAYLHYSGGGYGSALSAALQHGQYAVAKLLRAAEGGPNAVALRLLDLPAEVRQIIYKYLVLGSTHPHKALMRIMPPSCLSHNSAEAVVYNVPSCLRNILQCSRLMRNEFLPIFWAIANFELSPLFFGPKIGRIGRKVYNNLRRICIYDSIAGHTALADVSRNLGLLRSLPQLWWVEVGFSYGQAIQQVLQSETLDGDLEISKCGTHTRERAECAVVRHILQRSADDEKYNFVFWMRAPSWSRFGTVEYIPQELALCSQLSCRILYALAQFFAPLSRPLDQSTWGTISRKRFSRRIVGNIDISDLPAVGYLADPNYDDSSLFRVLMPPHTDKTIGGLDQSDSDEEICSDEEDDL